MKLYFASDHAGFDLRAKLVAYARELGHEVEDLGAHAFDPEDDYPDFITPCATRVAAEPESRGVILGGSGQGEAMCANRVPGVRAAVFYGPARERGENGRDLVALAREHNDANVLSLGARFVSEAEARAALDTFLATPFSAIPHHARRLGKF